MDPLSPGDPRTIGGYRLLGRLGEGGMGRVYLARSPRGRTVAVKTVAPALARETEFRARFAQEVAAARRVGGVWTAPVLDADTDADVPWLATGYVAGPTLHEVVSEGHGPLPTASLEVLAGGLVRALRDIHGTGLVHRDLKPSNVLVTTEGPRLIDFGIARALDTVTAAGLTRSGAVIGSPGFMSPEQVRGERVTPASDVFALGSVLVYAATGRLAFRTEDSGAHALIYRILEADPDLTDVPEPLRTLAADCLHKSATERPTVAQLLERTREAEQPGEWLPAPVLAALTRHVVTLLESEYPDTPDDSEAPTRVQRPAPPPAPAPTALDPAVHRPAPAAVLDQPPTQPAAPRPPVPAPPHPHPHPPRTVPAPLLAVLAVAGLALVVTGVKWGVWFSDEFATLVRGRDGDLFTEDGAEVTRGEVIAHALGASAALWAGLRGLTYRWTSLAWVRWGAMVVAGGMLLVLAWPLTERALSEL